MKKNCKADALSGLKRAKTESKDFHKDSLLKLEQMVGFDDVDYEASYLALVINFVNDIKLTYRQDKMEQEIFKEFAENFINIYNKNH